MKRSGDEGRAVAWACLLVLLFVVVGFVVVPAHRHTIWLDSEFSGWAVGVGNRVAGGQRLYADGGHTPSAPLAIVLLGWLSGGEGTWLTESAVNYVFQCLIVMTLFVGFVRAFGVCIAGSAAAAAFAIFMSLSKMIVNDPMAQWLVALAAIVGVGWAVKGGVRVGWVETLVLGFCCGSLLVVKQSTAVGGIAGVVMLLALYPRGMGYAGRLGNVMWVVGASAVAWVGWLCVLSPWVDVGGMIYDVYLTGAEPKGGLPGLLRSVRVSLAELLLLTGLFAVPALIAQDGIFVTLRRGSLGRRLGCLGEERFAWAWALAGAVAFGGACGVLWMMYPERSFLAVVRSGVMCSGLVVCLLATTQWALGGRRMGRGEVTSHAVVVGALGAFSVVLLPAVIGHNLSVVGFAFRWDYDNNPLLAVVLAALVYVLGLRVERGLRRLLGQSKASTVGRWVSGLVVVGIGCLYLPRTVAEVSACSEKWPEIRHLAGANLPKRGAAMRELVRQIRLVAGPQGEVLLLPSDTNVEAWIDRPRPKLSSPWIVLDQYWDRYVDEDFARLAQQPPRVIVIGPKKVWLFFFRLLHHNWGAERLIRRVSDELLPSEYTHYGEFFIPHAWVGMDSMDVYVRK